MRGLTSLHCLSSPPKHWFSADTPPTPPPFIPTAYAAAGTDYLVHLPATHLVSAATCTVACHAVCAALLPVLHTCLLPLPPAPPLPAVLILLPFHHRVLRLPACLLGSLPPPTCLPAVPFSRLRMHTYCAFYLLPAVLLLITYRHLHLQPATVIPAGFLLYWIVGFCRIADACHYRFYLRFCRSAGAVLATYLLDCRFCLRAVSRSAREPPPCRLAYAVPTFWMPTACFLHTLFCHSLDYSVPAYAF